MRILDWADQLVWAIRQTEVLPRGGGVTKLDDMAKHFREDCHYHIHARGGRMILIGNGGSLAIASHLATDFSLAGWPALALTDSVAITSHTNDFGAESNIAKQLELLRITPDDVIVAMSCSGKSPNIICAVSNAIISGCDVYTFSGFERGNHLSTMGKVNVYVPSHSYGIVQLAHEAILHAICDNKMESK